MSKADQSLAAELGITSEMLTQPDQGAMSVWPDHVDAVRLFQAMNTQWRVGFGGPVGLDYSVLRQVARWVGVRPVDAELFEQLQIMESEVLTALSEE